MLFTILLVLPLIRALETCGEQQYDPDNYVCHHAQYLCPIINGEGLSWCSGACYSEYMYTCSSGTLGQLPTYEPNDPLVMTLSNPQIPELDGTKVQACNQGFNAGDEGQTCAVCQLGREACQQLEETETSLDANNSMNVEVPRGQRWYTAPHGFWKYTLPEGDRSKVPEGSQTDGFAAFQNGALVNLQSPGGWRACPPTSPMAPSGLWTLTQYVEGTTFEHCKGVNVLVHLYDGPGAWQYS